MKELLVRRAEDEGVPVSEVIREALRHHLKTSEPGATRRGARIFANGLPTNTPTFRRAEAYCVDTHSELISQNATQCHSLDSGIPPAKPWTRVRFPPPPPSFS
ncbi:MAG: ribbon-helix-helix domain-containing protein [Acidimicrobiia bacterium]